MNTIHTAADLAQAQADYSDAQTAAEKAGSAVAALETRVCLLYTSPSPRDRTRSRMPSSA